MSFDLFLQIVRFSKNVYDLSGPCPLPSSPRLPSLRHQRFSRSHVWRQILNIFAPKLLFDNFICDQNDQIGRFFKVLGKKVPCKSCPNIQQRFWAMVKNATFYVKLMWRLFGQLLQKIGQPFTPPSGHTVYDRASIHCNDVKIHRSFNGHC